MMGQPGSQHTSQPANHPPDMAARESREAPDIGQPRTGPGGPTPGAGHAPDPFPPPAHEVQTAGHASAAPSTAAANCSDGGTPGDATSGEAPTEGPPQAHAESNNRAATPKHPGAQQTGGRRLADTLATTNLITPSWRPAGAPPQQTQRQLPHAATRSHEATI